MQRSPILGFLAIFAYTLYCRTTKFEVVTHCGEVLVLGVSHAPILRGRGPSAPQFWGFLSIYEYTPYRKTTKFDVVTHMGSHHLYRNA